LEQNLPEHKLTPAQYRRNAIGFGSDLSLFGVAMAFISSSTVLPAFIKALTQSEVLVGVASGLTSAAWMLPQLVVASLVAQLPRKKPVMVTAACIGRPLMLVLAAVIWLLGDRAPMVTVGITMATLFIFFVIDSVVSIPWFDVIAVALPPRRRGRLLGIGTALSGIGGIGAGLVVRYVLSDACPLVFPTNFALLYGLAGIVFVISAIGLLIVIEPEGRVEAHKKPGLRAVVRSLPRILRQDAGFQAVTAVRIVNGLASIATAFYVLYATDHLGFGIEDTGYFVSAQVMGSLVAGLLMGLVQDKWGPLTHMRILILVTVTPPLLALLAAPMAALWAGGVWYVYLLLYLCLGISFGTMGWPFFNWIMESAPDAERPLYIGLINTLSALTMLAPTLGGVIVRHASYQVVFALAVLFCIVAWLLMARVPDTRGETAVPHEPESA